MSTLTDVAEQSGSEAAPLPFGSGAERLYPMIQSEAHTAPTAATLFLHGVVHTRSFAQALARGGYRGRSWPPDCLVVPHRRPDVYSIVVLDPAWAASEPRTLWLSLDRDEVAQVLARRLRRLPRAALETELPIEDIADLAKAGPVHVVIDQAPEMQSTGAWAPAVPVLLAGTASASAGVLASRPGSDRVGVTTARHLFASAGLGPTPGVTRVTVAGHPATVDAEDAMSDAAFLLLDDPHLHPASLLGPPAYKGLLSGMTPRQNDPVTFHGVNSGAGSTVVRGWSPELPWVAHDMQMRVVTDLVTAPGDSGAALLDSDGKVCGLAFKASKWGVKPAISSWIWADSALSGLGLVLHP